ncbi:MAG: energy-coupling factor transporter transmembrane protein EcfT [Anaerolineales bacterium]|jgi:energy-coupling factor transporter transmembrane protein EcfT|nr:energy-coupling factor transporter transmembrane protein EcfT [Anaerolineales bacterium]
MVRLSQAGKARRLVLVENSPLRQFDPRAKLALSLCASLMVMLPLERLALFCLLYLLLLAWGRLLKPAATQVWRMRWILLVLFAVDWWLVGIDLAVIITLRLVLLAGVFALLFSTTTITEFRLALERMRLPYRYAFSLSLAFESLSLLDDEWRAIREAQKVRGVLLELRGFRSLIRQARDLVALTVPAVVLTTRRAWAITEAAYARGFDSPRRVSYHVLILQPRDWLLVLDAILLAVIFIWR